MTPQVQQAGLEGILASPKPVVVLCGPAGAGKTSLARAMLHHFEAQNRRCLLLVPNAAAAARIRRRLLEESPTGVLVNPAVYPGGSKGQGPAESGRHTLWGGIVIKTFEELAERVLSTSGDGGGAMSPFHRRLLLRRIVEELAASGKLPILSAVADTPGIVTALDAAIAEIKRAAINPDSLARAIGKNEGKAADLLTVYRRYQDHLLATGTYDPEGLMWEARDHLAKATDGCEELGLDEASALAVDGFTDFTPTQLEVIKLLSKRMAPVLITLPWSAEGRERLWRWSQRTLDNIRRVFGDSLHEIHLDARQGGPSQTPGDGHLRMLWKKLFDYDTPACPVPEGLSVIAAHDQEGEVVAVATRVKRLLMEGAKPGSIAVLARSMTVYRSVIERVFADFLIPIAASPMSLADQPIVRFVFNVAAIGPQFLWRDVLRVIKNSYFRPETLGPYNAATVAAAEALIRQGNILQGRDFYARTAQRLAEQAANRGDEKDEDESTGGFRLGAEEIRSAAAMLERLFEISESAAVPKANASSNPPDDSSALVAVIERLDLRAAACHDSAELTARDLRALDELEGLLAELPHPPPAPSVVLEAMSAEHLPPPRRNVAVDIMDVLDARSLRYEHVFCLGLGEGQFPPRYTEGSLISEADRQGWARGGVTLDGRNDLTAREMFLFYLAASRADRTLTVSFPQAETAGRIGAAGAFLLALLEPLGGLEAAERAGIVTRISPGVMVSPEADLASPRDAFLAAVAGRFHDGYDPSGSAMAWTRAQFPDRLARAAAGLFANARRWREGPPDSFDGRIGDEGLLAGLGEKFGPRSVFSATQLGTFGQCPWRFFATYILELQPPTEPQRRLEAIHRGLFCHKVLFETMRRLRKTSDGSVRIGEVDQASLLKALEAAVADVSAAIESRGLSYPALWRVQRDQMHAQVRDYLLAQRQDKLLAAESLYFELAFGQRGSQAASDSPGTLPPVTIATENGEFLLDGRIDRVDCVSLEDFQGLLVVDYKTGRLPSATDIAAGRSLQLPLYSAAAEGLLKRPCLGGVFHHIGGGTGPQVRFFASFNVARGEVKPNEKFAESYQKAIDLAGRFVEAIRRGRYDLAPSDDKRCDGCPYLGICHYSDPRATRKQPAVPEESP